jgi:haloacetate dehalogenase
VKIIVVGASGTIGSAVADALEPRHDVVRASRRGDPRVDLADPASIAALFASVRDADAVVCCGASAPLTALAHEGFLPSLQGKLLGQVELARRAVAELRDGGSITLTSGRIPEATPGSAGGALVNAGLEAFVTAATVELPRGLRLNVVSPGWVRETLVELGLDATAGTPAAVVARAYVESVEGAMQGQTIAPRAAPAGIAGFEYATVPVGPTTYRPGVAGDGPAVLLLHGFPQTHYCWHRVAPVLAGRSAVVVCDLKGYGESRSAPGGPLGEGYSNRERAAELVELMGRLGFERFSVVGHDRGGRVAYRMALDHPEAVERLAVLNIVPTVDQFERMAAAASLEYYPWLLLAQPPPFAERLVGAGAEHFLRHTLSSWAATPDAISPQATEHYLRAFTPEAISGICADYRASFHIDRPMDAEDRAAGRPIRCPVLVHWGAEEGAMSDGPLPVWRRWADAVEGGPLPSGHFIPEEAPEALLASLQRFLSQG